VPFGFDPNKKAIRFFFSHEKASHLSKSAAELKNRISQLESIAFGKSSLQVSILLNNLCSFIYSRTEKPSFLGMFKSSKMELYIAI